VFISVVMAIGGFSVVAVRLIPVWCRWSDGGENPDWFFSPPVLLRFLRLLCGAAVLLRVLEHGQSFPVVFYLLQLLYFVLLQHGLAPTRFITHTSQPYTFTLVTFSLIPIFIVFDEIIFFVLINVDLACPVLRFISSALLPSDVVRLPKCLNLCTRVKRWLSE